jgi:hypothetical protein
MADESNIGEMVFEINAGYSCLIAAHIRLLMDNCSESIRLQGHAAQHAAYDTLMLLIADQALPKELNEDAARRFGIYPSRFDTIETDDMQSVWAVLDGKIVGKINCLAIPVYYGK